MLKCLFFLLFVAASQASVTRKVRDTQRSISIPTLNGHYVFTSPVVGVRIRWSPSTNTDSSDPVNMYRIAVWEQIPNINRYRLFQEIHILGENINTAAVARIKPGLWYSYSVHPITRNQKYGPAASHPGFMVTPTRDGGKYTISYMNSNGEITEDEDIQISIA